MERTRAPRSVALIALAAGLALLGAAALAPTGGRVVHALTNCTVGSHQEIDSEEQQFLQLINQYRQQNGRQPLSLSTNLNRAAAWMAEDMATKNYFSHTDSLGRNASGRAQDCGYPGGAGENIAAGTNWSTAQHVFDAWKGSSGHDANMLNSSYIKIGIARFYDAGSNYKWYWVTDFGLVDDGTSTNPTATATRTPTRTSTPVAPTSTPPPPTKTPGLATPTSASASPTPTTTKAPATPTKTSVPPTATPTTPGDTPPLLLANGANLVTWTGPNTSPATALQKQGSTKVIIIYSYDPATRTWSRHGRELPGYANNLRTLRAGEAYWFITNGSTSLVVK